MSDVSVRSATLDDAGPLLVIYRPFVLNTAISFELEPPSVAEFRGRIERSLGEWAWLVAERDRRPVGYAYATPHRSRGAYKWSVEPSVYVDEGSHRQGIGKMLYETLLPLLTQRILQAYAGITLPNDPSVALLRRLAFSGCGSLWSVGRKFGVCTMSHGGIFAYVRNLRMSSGVPSWRVMSTASGVAAPRSRWCTRVLTVAFEDAVRLRRGTGSTPNQRHGFQHAAARRVMEKQAHVPRLTLRKDPDALVVCTPRPEAGSSLILPAL